MGREATLSSTSQRRNSAPRHFERLESRRLLCEVGGDELMAPVEIGGGASVLPGEAGPQLTQSSGAAAAASPATIDWTNRGSMRSDSDGFNSVFGAGADAARAVVDAVIQSYMRMITSFNYSDGSNTYSLSLSMNTTGTSLGASANLLTTLGGKPRSGEITMGRGGDLTGDGLGDGGLWFVDPTPLESSEFQSSIVNAYAGDAPSTSLAFGKGDFFTVVAAEMTHLMGLYGGVTSNGEPAVPLWDAHTSDTGIADTAEGGGIGHFWVFQGPSIKHLMTGNNGGAGGNSYPGAVHSAGPNVNVIFGGDIYVGAQDQGNAVYEFSRRYMIDDAFALMFKDAYGYTTVNPDQFGTMYSNLNTSTRNLLVRGSTSVSDSNDTITINQSGSIITVSVDLGLEVGGIGALPGVAALPAFVSKYDVSQITSITIKGLSGNDTISLSNIGPGIAISVTGGNGNDTINVNGFAAGSSVSIDGNAGDDSVNVSNTAPGAAVSILANWGLDTVSVTSGSANFPASAQLSALTINAGGVATVSALGTSVLTVKSLLIAADGALDINDNALIVDYTGPSPLGNVLVPGTLAGFVASGYSGGAWNGAGIRSAVAASSPAIDSIGYGEATDLFSSFPATFLGQSVDQTSVLMRYTLASDANLDRSVDTIDFNLLSANFASPLPRNFTQADFNYDGAADTTDFNLLAANFSLALSSSSQSAAVASKPPAGTTSLFGASPIVGSLPLLGQDKDSADDVLADVL